MSGTHNIYMVAICGTGMGTLAGMLQARGHRVTGSDEHVYPPMSDQLAGQGIAVKEGFDPANVPDNADLVVIGNAVSKDNVEVVEVLKRDLRYVSFPAALYEFFIREKTSIVVTGTHGKTTTTALIARTLDASGRDPSFLAGGVLKDYGASFRLGDGPHFVSEGDEYDSAFFDKEPKFLHYRPDILVVGNLEFDHADIYRDLAHIEGKFEKLVSMMPPSGTIVAGRESPSVRKVLQDAPCTVTCFGLDEDAGWTVRDRAIRDGRMAMTVVKDGREFCRLDSCMAGEHNARNLLATTAACDAAGLLAEEIAPALSTFSGVKRRQEEVGRAGQIVVIDDFAHHPTAVDLTLHALKERYPDRQLWAVFEPRSATTRRNVFQSEWGGAFEAADMAVVAPLYAPEKIPPDQRLDLDRLADDIGRSGTCIARPGDYDAILDFLVEEARQSAGQVAVVFLSSGGFGGLPKRILEQLK